MFEAQFAVGQLVEHRLFGYRGVIYDVDPTFQGSEEWYQQVARSKPPRDEPWYRVLVHGRVHETYVAERNLDSDDSGEPVRHPLLDALFDSFSGGVYHRRRTIN